jgi:hypothetical protein
MRKIMIALLIAMISITIALAGIKKGNIEKNFQYNTNIRGEDRNVYTRSYEATLGPYYQLWANAGYTYIGKVKDRTGRYLDDTEIGDLAEEYYNSGGSNYWNFDDWLISQGYTLEDFRFHSDRVLDKARNLVNNAQASFEQELITAFGGFNFNGGSDWERSSWPGRRTGIYDIKSGSINYIVGSYSESFGEGDVNITKVGNLTATFNYQVNAVVIQSPIVLDLNGDNKLDTYNNHYLPVEDINDYKNLRLREFDISNIGYKMLVEHIGPNDGYLVKPKNVELTLKTGKIEADEMFGTAGGFSDGFQKLSLLDKNKDNKLTQEELKGLYVFIDKNMNFKVDKGELKSLSELGITEIGLNHNNYESYYIRNGKKYKMWDFWPITLDVRKVK